MNNYPVWWDTTVTIYNKYENPTTNLVTWYKKSVPNCFWKYTGEKVVVGEAVLNTNSIICRIPKNAQYLDRHDWELIPNDQKNQYFTLSPSDIIIKGEVQDIIDEYQAGKRSTDLISKYKRLQGCLEIKASETATGIGRCCEHYYVLGE